MHLYAFSSIGGLHIYGKDSKQTDKDILRLKVEKEDLSGLAVAMIQEVGADASPGLIEKCRELVQFADEHLTQRGVDTSDEELTDGQIAFIQRLEDNAGESKRDHETMAEYYKRLESDYGAPPI
jgi:hypothetical protein